MKLDRAARESLKTATPAAWELGRQAHLASRSAARELAPRAQAEKEEGGEGQHGKAPLPIQGAPSLPKGRGISRPPRKQAPPHGSSQAIPGSRAACQPQGAAWAKRQPKQPAMAGQGGAMGPHAMAGQGGARNPHAAAGQGRRQARAGQGPIAARKGTLAAAKRAMPPPGSPGAPPQAARQETEKTPAAPMAPRGNIPAGWGAAAPGRQPGKARGHTPPGWETVGGRSAPSHKTPRDLREPPQAGAMAASPGRGAALAPHGATIAPRGITITPHGARQAAKGAAPTAGRALGATTAGTAAAAAAIPSLAGATAEMARRWQGKIKEAMAATMAGRGTGREAPPGAAGRRQPHWDGPLAFLGMAAMAFFLPICLLLMLPATAGMTGGAIPRGPGNGAAIVEVARGEAAGVHRGGAKYKEWYGMDDNWCAMFVSWCADQCGYLEQGIMPKTASVSSMQSWYMGKGLYQAKESGYEPVAGDIVIFKNGRSHVGIVAAYDAPTKTITTIEGNTGPSGEAPYHSGSQVKEREYHLSEGTISGYGTPLYPPPAGQDAAGEGTGSSAGGAGGNAEETGSNAGGAGGNAEEAGGNAEETGSNAGGADGTAEEAGGAMEQEGENADQNQ